jgi:predicted nucleotidyltransferase
MDVEGIVRKISGALGDKALFIGGVALEAYVAYRRTQDIDVVVREGDLHLLRELLEEEGFRYRYSPHLAKHVLKARRAGEVDAYTMRVGEREVDESLFSRARSLPFAGVTIRVAGLEDLIAVKLSASHEMHLADVAVLLWERREELDVDLLEDLVGHETLGRSAPSIVDALPMEYGWVPRQRLKAWLGERGWLS